MRKEEFSRLSISQKIKTLYLEGSFVVAIRYYRHKVNLYLLGDEYVEVFYNHKLDQIEKIEFLARKHSRMKFYLDQIKLWSIILDREWNKKIRKWLFRIFHFYNFRFRKSVICVYKCQVVFPPEIPWLRLG